MLEIMQHTVNAVVIYCWISSIFSTHTLHCLTPRASTLKHKTLRTSDLHHRGSVSDVTDRVQGHVVSVWCLMSKVITA